MLYRLEIAFNTPTLQGPRAQADRKLYRSAIQDIMFNTPNLTIYEGSVANILTNQTTNTKSRLISALLIFSLLQQ